MKQYSKAMSAAEPLLDQSANAQSGPAQSAVLVRNGGDSSGEPSLSCRTAKSIQRLSTDQRSADLISLPHGHLSTSRRAPEKRVRPPVGAYAQRDENANRAR
jgi:hypothetical protein